MDSQGRSRLIIGGLSLAAVVLVISLLLTQQSGRLPAAVESPLVNAPAAAVSPTVETATPVAVATTASVAQVASPLASPDVVTSAALPVTQTVAVTETDALTATDSVSATNAVSTTVAVSVSAQSTVTVTLAAPLPLRYGYEVIASYPHDPDAYTQGLQYVNGVLYEGTGLYGRSSLRRVDLESGTVEQQVNLPEQFFGEGIYVLEDRIYQLTWKSRIGFLYDLESFKVYGDFSYPTEGWGLTYDGQDLLMSDGSATIFRRDPETFAEEGRITVQELGEPVNLLNELEYIEGDLWANVWQTNEIVIIDPANGEVIGRVDLAGLLPSDAAASADVLNGIAYDDDNDRIFVTGKFWPTLFEIQVMPR